MAQYQSSIIGNLFQELLDYFQKKAPFLNGRDQHGNLVEFSVNNKMVEALSFDVSGITIRAAMGDITDYTGDAIVNAANTMLVAAAGGVCGCIFRASDFDTLNKACEELGACPTGEACVTPSFGMPATWIVHAVGPVWKGGFSNEATLLENTYKNALSQAHLVGARSIAFPAISTGTYGYPLKEATRIAINAIAEYASSNPNHFTKIEIVCFDDDTLQMYVAGITERFIKNPEGSVLVEYPNETFTLSA